MDCLKVTLIFLLACCVQCRFVGQPSEIGKRTGRSITADHFTTNVEDNRHLNGNTVSDPTQRLNPCCEIGSFLAESKYNCLQKPFQRAELHLKLHLIQTLPDDIGVDVTDVSHAKLFSHFRKCVLKQAHEIDKCCVTAYSEKNDESASFDYSKDTSETSPYKKHTRNNCHRLSNDWPRCRHFSTWRHVHSAHARHFRHYRRTIE